MTFDAVGASPDISLTPATRLAYGSEPEPWQIVHVTTLLPPQSTHGWLFTISSLRLPAFSVKAISPTPPKVLATSTP